jgi:heme/copper-type cytochrome/quinol oxidase subunit 2
VLRHVTRPRLIVATFALLALAFLVVPLGNGTSSAERTVHIDATQFEFEPGRIHVNQGDRVVIKLTASDVVHGFYLDGYGIERRVEPGVMQEITFVANKAGKFRYRCAVSCGPLHPFMIGELVVNANTPYWRALGVVLSASAGMLVFLWQAGRNESFEEITHESKSRF